MFWITERGEISYHLKHVKTHIKKNCVPWDNFLIITKNIDNLSLQDFLLEHQTNTILHATITGYGGTQIEPGVSLYTETIKGLNSLIYKGFPAAQIVLRIDPIIPTEEGLKIAFSVGDLCPTDVRRIRISFIDGYKHVKHLLPWTTFHAPITIRKDMLKRIQERYNDKEIEICGEPDLEGTTGCISNKDYSVLKQFPPASQLLSNQRHGCKCLSSKKELLTLPKSCPNGCVYCYYKLGK